MDDSTFFFSILILAGLVFGIVAVAIAEPRGGSPFGAFFLGAFLGPIGLLIACFIGSPEGRARRELELGTSKKCPRCAETVKRQALVCRFCGHEFDMPSPETGAAVDTTDENSSWIPWIVTAIAIGGGLLAYGINELTNRPFAVPTSPAPAFESKEAVPGSTSGAETKRPTSASVRKSR